MEWLNSIFPNVAKLWPYIVKSLNETLIMVSISGVFAALLGVPLGIVLAVTKKGELFVLSAALLHSFQDCEYGAFDSLCHLDCIHSLACSGHCGNDDRNEGCYSPP